MRKKERNIHVQMKHARLRKGRGGGGGDNRCRPGLTLQREFSCMV